MLRHGGVHPRSEATGHENCGEVLHLEAETTGAPGFEPGSAGPIPLPFAWLRPISAYLISGSLGEEEDQRCNREERDHAVANHSTILRSDWHTERATARQRRSTQLAERVRPIASRDVPTRSRAGRERGGSPPVKGAEYIQKPLDYCDPERGAQAPLAEPAPAVRDPARSRGPRTSRIQRYHEVS